jgi:hypothetical protein
VEFCAEDPGARVRVHFLGMNNPSGSRRRCVSCRDWYEAAPSARGHQKVCGKEECRRKRRRRLAKKRREQDLHEHRVEERERQRRCRERRRQRDGQARDDPQEMSRASLSAQALVLVEDFLESWDKVTRRSRATLDRRLRQILGETSAPLGQGGP